MDYLPDYLPKDPEDLPEDLPDKYNPTSFSKAFPKLEKLFRSFSEAFPRLEKLVRSFSQPQNIFPDFPGSLLTRALGRRLEYLAIVRRPPSAQVPVTCQAPLIRVVSLSSPSPAKDCFVLSHTRYAAVRRAAPSPPSRYRSVPRRNAPRVRPARPECRVTSPAVLTGHCDHPTAPATTCTARPSFAPHPRAPRVR